MLLEEHQILTTSTGLVDFSTRSHLEIRGADRATFLHNFCTNHVTTLQPGEGCEAFFCNAQGKILAFAAIFCDAESLWIETVPGQGAAILAHLDRYLIAEDVELIDRTAAQSEWLIAGAAAPELLATATGIAPPETQYGHQKTTIGGAPVVLRRVDWTNAPTYLAMMERADAAAVGDALRAAGARDCSAASYDLARIEAGTPEFGRDITDANLPQEVARDATAISFKKGCYLGQETVARIDAMGHVNWLLTPLRIAAETAPAPVVECLRDDKVAARITSAAYSPAQAHVVALGYVRSALRKPGAAFESPVGTVTIPE